MRKTFEAVVVLFAAVAGQAFAGSPVSKTEASALAERYGHPYLTQMLKDKGNTDAAASFEEKRVVADELSMVHVHVRQTFGGIPVWGGEAIVHMDRSGQIAAVTDDFIAKVKPAQSLRMKISSAQAIDKAM